LKPEYFIRKAREKDAENICKIESESFKNPWTIDAFLNEFRIPYSDIFVAEYNTKIIGYTVSWLVNDELHLHKIAVHADYRRIGIASALIDYLIRAFGKSISIILLEVRQKNTEARNFYKKLGFIENGIRYNYYPDDNAVLIEKMIE
jgi:ribosomal-protein-alanine N-acetyltransferase